MLVLGIDTDSVITIGADITIRFKSLKPGRGEIAIEAPRRLAILRQDARVKRAAGKGRLDTSNKDATRHDA